MKSLTIALILFTGLFASAQEAGKGAVYGIDYVLLDRYIQLAKEHYPQRKILELTRDKSESVYKAQPLAYLDMLNVAYFYRPNESRAINVDNPYVTNGFQFGVSLNLATFFQRPAQTKQARIDYEIAQLQVQAYEDVLANEVRKRYYELQRAKEDLGIKTQALEEYKVLAEGLLYKFENGEVDLTVYSTAKTAVSTAETALLQARMSELLAQDALEEVIGTKLSEVVK